jgi:hypothetical protein
VMLRHLALALLAVGCVSAPPPQPRVVERVVYVQSPCPAPVIVERQGHRGEPKAHPVKRPTAVPPFGKWMKRAHAKPAKPGKVTKRGKRARDCNELSTPEARENCRVKTARR